MRFISKKNVGQMLLPLVSVLIFSLFLQSCATKFAFQKSAYVPAAEGTVHVKKDKNKNYQIDLKIRRLAKSERLTPPKNVYVVWVVTASNSAQNIGQLKTSSGLLSRSLKSSLKTVTSFKPSEFFITAEDKADVQYPGSQIVLRTKK